MKKWLLRHFGPDVLLQALRISVGVILSILIAEGIGIDFAPSTGIIALLGIQYTRRENLQTAFRRIVSFLYTLGFAYWIHQSIGNGIEAFSVLVLVVIFVSVIARWENTLSINIVIAVHLFMSVEGFTNHLLLNETERLMIGMFVAFLVNWRTPNIQSRVEKKMSKIETEFEQLMSLFADSLIQTGSLEQVPSLLKTLQEHLEDATTDAYTLYNNALLPYARYYLDCIAFRKQEYERFQDLYTYTNRITKPSPGAEAIHDEIQTLVPYVPIQKSLKEYQPLLTSTEAKIATDPLPTTREEFNHQANLAYIQDTCRQLLNEKETFLKTITPAQIAHYWHKEKNENV